MPSKRKIVPIAESVKDKNGRVLLVCEYRGKVRKLTFNGWGELIDRPYKLIKRAYYGGHTARVCLGFDPWPDPVRAKHKAEYNKQVVNNMFDKLARKGLCPKVNQYGD